MPRCSGCPRPCGRGSGRCSVAMSVSRKGTRQAGRAQPRARARGSCLCSWLPSLGVWGCGRGVYSPSIDNPGRLAGRGEHFVTQPAALPSAPCLLKRLHFFPAAVSVT